YFFFFQAEDGIRDKLVTGVQTCALPISAAQTPSADVRCRRSTLIARLTPRSIPASPASSLRGATPRPSTTRSASSGPASVCTSQIGRASCRERVWQSGTAVCLELYYTGV